jgi:hypothetical protein
MLFRSNNQFVYFLKNADCNIYSNGQSVSDKKGNKNVHLQRGAKKILESNRARPPYGRGPEKLFKSETFSFAFKVLFGTHSMSVSRKIVCNDETFSFVGAKCFLRTQTGP